MDVDEVRRRILKRYGIRVEPEMGSYALKKLLGKGSTFAVMGGDARTGVAVRLVVDPVKLNPSAETDAGANQQGTLFPS